MLPAWVTASPMAARCLCSFGGVIRQFFKNCLAEMFRSPPSVSMTEHFRTQATSPIAGNGLFSIVKRISRMWLSSCWAPTTPRIATGFRKKRFGSNTGSSYLSTVILPPILASWFVHPPCAFQPINSLFYITNDAKLDRIPDIAQEVITIADTERVELVDLYALTVGRRELFGPDGLHPSVAGARAIAEEVFRIL